MSRTTVLLFILFICTGVSAQATDTLPSQEIPLVTVRVTGEGARVYNAAAVAEIRQEELERYDESSLLAGLNRLPGVRFEERATGSYRIAIRGASLRSPFGVRNTQVYWNGIPFGEPGGDVPLNFLDASNIDEVVVWRGPNGGLYGPGTAGTLQLRTNSIQEPGAESKGLSFSGSLAAGSFGYLRGDLTAERQNSSGDQKQLRVGYQRTDGFRDHSALDRLTVQYSEKRIREDRESAFHVLYTDLSYELPGGLNAEQFAENPRQARPGSADKNASINYHNLLLGWTNTREFNGWTSNLALYATGFYFDHPFNFDYKRETNLGGGGRFSLRRLIRDDLDVVVGAESRLQFRFANNFTNPDGTGPGALNFSDEIYSNEGLLFAQARYQPKDWEFTLGLSSSGLFYNVDRTFSTEVDQQGETDFTSTRPLNLRLAIGRNFGDHHLYVSRADGFSPPTLDEFRTNEGSLNTELDPEVGVNYELGYRYTRQRFQLRATIFHFQLQEAINSFADERGTQLFRNSGRTTQNGLELDASYSFDLASKDWSLNLYGSYTYYDFTYRDLQRNGTDFSGQQIPGAAPHTTNAEVNAGWRKLSLSLFHSYVDDIPLNDENNVFGESFNLVRARIAYRFGKVTVFAAGSNLLDERLSFGNDLNPQFGGRFFQPGPGRNFQLGVRY